MIVEPIYETQFSNQSFGFRPGRSCHTAFKWMNTNMKDSIWFLEGDIKSYFDTIDHAKLIELLRRRIQDDTIIKLIKTGLRAKIFYKKEPPSVPEIGTPQGGILSPLLSNIYLHELDLFMAKLSEEYQGNVKANNRRKNPLVSKLLAQGKKREIYRLRIPNRIPDETGYRNCKYVRYADDFVVGILGPRSMAIEIRNKIKQFLKQELNIDLSMEKTKIAHISKKIEFLGHLFGRKNLFVRQQYSGKIVKRRMTIPTLDVNMNKVIKRLKEVQFCDGNGTPEPAFR